jgi:hypothetical protein
MEEIKVGQKWKIKDKNHIVTVVKVTEKSVKVSHEILFYWSDYPQKRTNIITKDHLRNFLTLVSE